MSTETFNFSLELFEVLDSNFILDNFGNMYISDEFMVYQKLLL